ncbi:23S rRNA (pseudouridine(1915)-N(3))-methyltransferase RlmH [Desulfogranum japonicum]|uniref:23S rRNA (pseudouridine(1915)-N(3))-methyltransferase RlmH n=1 Tax=Desulfogranum japonicum TaxID=231447 RepID=UPI0003F60967|nr:23S rRNA (pseudouridine(1915)-N(3))-methyltransferase RlmH [Desulfogranum japonicum]
MKIIIPFLGKTKEKFLQTGIDEYLKRLRHYSPVTVPVIRTVKDRQASEDKVKQIEAGLLLERIPASGSTAVVALDPLGATIDSPALAALLQQWQNQGTGTVTWLIGGHLGLHSSVLQQSDKVISLSALTFTHEMTRLILLEQLYRAYTILGGHKYHK